MNFRKAAAVERGSRAMTLPGTRVDWTIEVGAINALSTGTSVSCGSQRYLCLLRSREFECTEIFKGSVAQHLASRAVGGWLWRQSDQRQKNLRMISTTDAVDWRKKISI